VFKRARELSAWATAPQQDKRFQATPGLDERKQIALLVALLEVVRVDFAVDDKIDTAIGAAPLARLVELAGGPMVDAEMREKLRSKSIDELRKLARGEDDEGEERK
jgi:hypothetical protein